MSNVINLAKYRNQRAKRLNTDAAAMVKASEYELSELVEYLTERGLGLLGTMSKLPEGSDAQMRVEDAAQLWLDMARVAAGGDPIGERREMTARWRLISTAEPCG